MKKVYVKKTPLNCKRKISATSLNDDNVSRKLERVVDNDDDERCMVCGLLFSGLIADSLNDSAESVTESHIRKCLQLDGIRSHVATVSTVNQPVLLENSDNSDFNEKETCGLLEKSFYCVLCDINLSRRCLLSRCKHLKQCAKQNKVATRELLLMVGSSVALDENRDAVGTCNEIIDALPDGMLPPDVEVGSSTHDFFKPRLELKKGVCGSSKAEAIVIYDSDDEFNSNTIAISGGFNLTVSHDETDVVSTDTTSVQSVNNENSESAHSMNNEPRLTEKVEVDKANNAPQKQNAFSFLMQGAMNVASAIGIASGNKSKKSSTDPGSKPVALPSSNSTHLVGSGIKAKADKKNSSVVSKTESGSGTVKYSIPSYKKIQVGSTTGSSGRTVVMSMPIVVDGFQWASEDLSDCYFLTHFHSDHTVGLKASFNYGRIYCTATTAALVKMKIGVKMTSRTPNVRLIALELERTYTIAVGGVNVDVTFIDANHCPGAVCILFSFEGGKRKFLHTGDFRWCVDGSLFKTSPTYRSLKWQKSSNGCEVAKNLTVYLDTTYCKPEHVFPPQNLMISAVVECVVKDMKAQTDIGRDPLVSTLYLFGAYSIGKERVYMSVAERLNCKVHVDNTRWKTMMCYDSWSMQEKARLTKDEKETNLWVMSMGALNFNNLISIRKQREQLGCIRIVAFVPTGWSFSGRQYSSNNKTKPTGTASATKNDYVPSPSKASSTYLRPRVKGPDTIYSLPYSEHSSFSELVDFINCFRPNCIIPTVDTKNSSEQLEVLRRGNDEVRHFAPDAPGPSEGHIVTIANSVGISVPKAKSEFF